MAAPVAPIIFGGLIAWGIYRRVRRNIGRQKLRPVRSVISICIFTLVSLLVLCTAAHDLRLFSGMAGGLVCGILLGFLGLRLTRFETTAEGHFYTPDTRIGLTLSLLFAGRMLYRMWTLSDTQTSHTPPQFFHSPLTLFLFGLIAGYSIVYYVGLFVHTRDKG